MLSLDSFFRNIIITCHNLIDEMNVFWKTSLCHTADQKLPYTSKEPWGQARTYSCRCSRSCYCTDTLHWKEGWISLASISTHESTCSVVHASKVKPPPPSLYTTLGMIPSSCPPLHVLPRAKAKRPLIPGDNEASSSA